ncbi:hypothetical protein NE237_012235 [Protea cynaroides]|uniref:Uncharacterized protein n=1 Tax=Protea cynaroides TaxID=273540 RepID=A0A9Q0H0P3_9MAGN|nr:hypothetical protein NE237_012235 [Protea cynaroides]
MVVEEIGEQLLVGEAGHVQSAMSFDKPCTCSPSPTWVPHLLPSPSLSANQVLFISRSHCLSKTYQISLIEVETESEHQWVERSPGFAAPGLLLLLHNCGNVNESHGKIK